VIMDLVIKKNGQVTKRIPVRNPGLLILIKVAAVLYALGLIAFVVVGMLTLFPLGCVLDPILKGLGRQGVFRNKGNKLEACFDAKAFARR